MATFADLTAKLNLNIQNFAGNLQKAAAQANKFAANLQGQINTGMVEPAKKAKFEFKDVARIVQGILISKVFYGGLNAIRNATTAVWEFSKQLEYAQMVYSTMFGDTKLATEFINVLKDFAAVTPFTFGQAEAAAKRLLAYGIKAENVMYVMQGVLAASTVQENPAVIESISRALGQIYTKGRLMNEEMRQLAEAGIPVYEILQEKLGVTAEQLRKLGKVAIPASTAINALVDGINERFGDTLIMSSMTTTGIISNIKDNALMLISGVFTPFTEKIRTMAASFGTFIAKLREAYELRGLGGVFEALIPPEFQAMVRTLIVNLMNLWDIIKTNLVSIFKILGTVIHSVIQVLNALLPVINMILGVATAITKAIAENQKFMKVLIGIILAAAAAWAVYKLQTLLAAATTAVVKGMIVAINGLVKVLGFLVAHPVWALLAVAVGLFIGLSGASDKFAASVRKLFGTFTSFGGVDADKILLPETKQREADLAKFNKRLGGTGDAMDDLADSTGKATKAAKGLLGFDEVFSIKTPDSDAADGITDNLDDLLAGLEGIGGDLGDLWKDVNFDGIASSFVDNLLDAFGGKDKVLGAGIGALLGAVLGTILGGPLGAKIGAIAGAIAGWFWDDLAKALGLTDTGKISVPVATLLGAIIGSLAGGPLGALIGGGIGALVGWLIDAIARGVETGDWSKIALPAGLGLGAAIGMIAGGPAGALIGGGIGALVGFITGKFIDGFSTNNWDIQGLSMSIGSTLGLVIGMIAGGPGGALIGVAIGFLVGWIVDLIIENWDAIAAWFSQAWKDTWSWLKQAGKDVGAWVSQAWKDTWSWIKQAGKDIGTFFVNLGKSIGTFFVGIGKWFADGWKSMIDWFSRSVDDMGSFFNELFDAIGSLFNELFSNIGTWFSEAWGNIIGFFNSMFTGIGTFFSNLWSTVSEWFTKLWDTIVEKLTGAWSSVSEWFTNIWNTIVEKLIGAWGAVSEWFTNIWNTMVEKLTGAWSSVTEWFTNIWNTMVEKLTGAWSSVTEWFTKIWDTIKEKLSGAWNSVSEWFTKIWTTIVEKLTSAWNSVSEWFTKIWGTIKEKLSGAWSSATEWFTKIWDTIKEKLSGAWNSVKEFFSGIYDTIRTKISDMYTSVRDGISNIYKSFTGWISNMWNNVFGKFFSWINEGINKLREFFGLESKAKSVDTSYTNTAGVTGGHALGGVFNREHVARFAEGNKAEAIIPLENGGAMQPFVEAVSDGLYATLAPLFASMTGSQEQRPILYVGNLIADDAGLRELNKRMTVINLQESVRRG